MVLKHEVERFCELDALELCKPHQLVVIQEVRYGGRGIFHRVFHTCVENFTPQKYSFKSSAAILLSTRKNYDPLKTQHLA